MGNGLIWLAAGFTIMFCVQLFCLWALWWCTTELKAMQRSTHSVQFVPADSAFQKMTTEVQESLNKDIFENLG